MTGPAPLASMVVTPLAKPMLQAKPASAGLARRAPGASGATAWSTAMSEHDPADDRAENAAAGKPLHEQVIRR